LTGETVAQYGTLVQLIGKGGVPSEIDWMRRICGGPAKRWCSRFRAGRWRDPHAR
jgi:hypothetical protein